MSDTDGVHASATSADRGPVQRPDGDRLAMPCGASRGAARVSRLSESCGSLPGVVRCGQTSLAFGACQLPERDPDGARCDMDARLMLRQLVTARLLHISPGVA